jgi:hypothetical protein
MTMNEQTLRDKLDAFAAKLESDPYYEDEFRAMSRGRQAQELLEEGFTLEEIGSMIADPDEAKAASLEAGKFWAV